MLGQTMSSAPPYLPTHDPLFVGTEMYRQLPREVHLHGFQIFATRTKHHWNKLKYFHVGATQQVPQSDGTSVLCKKVVLSCSKLGFLHLY